MSSIRRAFWTTARRVVPKVEHHVGELFPRVGFIVTNLPLKNRFVVPVYNSAGRRSKGSGKASRRRTGRGCRVTGSRANEVRLPLSVLGAMLWRIYALPVPASCPGALGRTSDAERTQAGRGVREMSQHPAASGQFVRAVNPADAVGSFRQGPRTHPAHAEGRLVYNGADPGRPKGTSRSGPNSWETACSLPFYQRPERPLSYCVDSRRSTDFAAGLHRGALSPRSMG